MTDTQFGILWFCIIAIGLYSLAKSGLKEHNQLSDPQQPVVIPPPPPHPLEHLILEAQNFSYIKFDGAMVYHCVTSSDEVCVAVKELKFFRKVLNADKKAINDQLRTIRANVAGVKGLASLPVKSNLLKGARYAIRASASAATLPLENQKSLYNSLLLQCDRVQIEIERL